MRYKYKHWYDKWDWLLFLIGTMLVTGIFLLLTISCEAPPPDPNATILPGGGTLHRSYDMEACVVCWYDSRVVGSGGGIGLSCLPIKDTSLNIPCE